MKQEFFQFTPGFYQSLKIIKESKKYIYFSIILFFIASLISFFSPMTFSFFDDWIKELVEKTKDLQGFDLIMFIFFNNLQSAFFAIIFGILFCLFPVSNALINGFVLGYVYSKVYSATGFQNFWMILPHGIFELPAIFISIGLGIRNGLFLFSKKPIKELKKRFFESIKVFFYIVLPLLFIAAIIEGTFITLFK